jgi:starch phosphorylase
MKTMASIAYFSMEIGIDDRMPTYSGGLGVLAGDTIHAAADLELPMVAVTLLHRMGYFYQKLDSAGGQSEEPVKWAIDDFLTEIPIRVSVKVEQRQVRLRAWKYTVVGVGGYQVPIYFLDSDLPENSDWDRKITHDLYGGDDRYRLCQEVVLGIGGVRFLRAIGELEIQRFHLNEGHPGLLTLELLDENARLAGRTEVTQEDVAAVRNRCVFTTHTPVPAGHDQFPMDLFMHVTGRGDLLKLKDVFCCGEVVNMTYLALNLSHYVNGVARRHGEVSQLMFGQHKIDAITNGVHAATWSAPPFQRLFDLYIPGWRRDHFSLRYALGISLDEIWAAHREAKAELIGLANHQSNAGLDLDVFTIGYARRAAAYKRPDLLFAEVDRLRRMVANGKPLQVIFAGKAHPRDASGKALIAQIFRYREMLKGQISIVYLENYGIELAKRCTAGVDLWLNTPEPPLEASGTSGMKAALNGVPSLSVLDGWWLEGHIPGVTGWAIGRDTRGRSGADRGGDAASLYDQLEQTILPLFYHEPRRFMEVMRHCIALNGSFFNTHRMILQYVQKAYF